MNHPQLSSDQRSLAAHPARFAPPPVHDVTLSVSADRMLSRQEAAKYLGIKPQTLAAWASNRRVQLPFVKLGRRVLYRHSDLVAFCAANLVGPTAGGDL